MSATSAGIASAARSPSSRRLHAAWARTAGSLSRSDGGELADAARRRLLRAAPDATRPSATRSAALTNSAAAHGLLPARAAPGARPGAAVGRGRGPLPPSVSSASARTARSRTPASASLSAAGDRLDGARVAELTERADGARAHVDVAVLDQRRSAARPRERRRSSPSADAARRAHARVGVLERRHAVPGPPRRSPICASADSALLPHVGLAVLEQLDQAGHRAAAPSSSERRGGLAADAGVAVLERADQGVGRRFRRALLRGDRARACRTACRGTGAA